jgi:hypothetical protein
LKNLKDENQNCEQIEPLTTDLEKGAEAVGFSIKVNGSEVILYSGHLIAFTGSILNAEKIIKSMENRW